MATDTEIRAWLRDRGRGDEVTARGKLRRGLRDDYERAHGNAPEGDTDYDGSVTEADFGPDAVDELDLERGRLADEADEQRQAAYVEPETTPRSTRPSPAERRGTAAARARSIWDRATGGTAAAAPQTRTGNKKSASSSSSRRRATRPWVSTAGIIEHVWSQLAWAARPLPPVQKILAAQAPMVGVLLEDAARDTAIDRYVLQPAARAEDRLQAVNATLGPVLWTTAIALRGQAMEDPQHPGEPLLDESGAPVWNEATRVMIGGLRFSLMSWLKVADKKADEIQQAAEELTELGDEADALIAWLLAPPDPGQSPKDVENEAKQRGRDFIIREPSSPTSSSSSTATKPTPGRVRGVPGGASQGEMTAHLEGMAQSSALRPAPAGTPKPPRG